MFDDSWTLEEAPLAWGSLVGGARGTAARCDDMAVHGAASLPCSLEQTICTRDGGIELPTVVKLNIPSPALRQTFHEGK